MSILKVWRYKKTELVEMHELKKGDLFQLEQEQIGSEIQPTDFLLAHEDVIRLDPPDENGATAEIRAHKLIFDPEWGEH
jgi:hypothetical protein